MFVWRGAGAMVVRIAGEGRPLDIGCQLRDFAANASNPGVRVGLSSEIQELPSG